MSIQYFIVAGIVLIVICFQLKAFINNWNKINRLNNLFPQDNDCSVVVINDITTIYSESADGEYKETIDDINSYLAKNKDKTFDYHILKEIVNRNSQSLEDEVDTMLSAPLYLGLVATIFGIAFGIIVFAWNDLAELLSGSNLNSDGIKVLLTDVGIAMVSSLVGVIATKWSTSNFNNAKTEMTKRKNRFLTWIQTDLLSKLSDDITGAILKMTSNLNRFNSTFSQNTKELRETLKTVNSNYDGQVKLLQSIERIKINKIAKANIEIYDRLEGCTEELEKLFVILSNSEEYVQKVNELNGKLGNIEERTQLFEELGSYFKNEIEFVKDRQGMMRQHMSLLDSVLQDALTNLGDNLQNSLQKLIGVFQTQNQGVQQLIEEQQRTLIESLTRQQQAVNEKIGQIDNPFAGLKETFEEGVSGIKSSFAEQNITITEMLKAQSNYLEEALKAQQQTILKKLQETPSQLTALSEIAEVVKRLNNSISRLESQLGKQMLTSVSSPQSGPPKKGLKKFLFKLKSNFIPICVGGSFLILLAMFLYLIGVGVK